MTARDPRTGRTAEGRSVRSIAEALEISVGSVHRVLKAEAEMV